MRNYNAFTQVLSAAFSSRFGQKIEHLILYPTGRCNLQCRHCFAHKYNNENNNLSFEEIREIAKVIRKPLWLDIGGGEPFLRKDLAEICDLFDAERVTIPTNGWFCEQIFETAKILSVKKHGRVTIVISLEGFQPIHDKIRGEGSFIRALKTFELLRDINGIRVGFSTTLNQENSGEIVDFFKEMKKYKPDFHGVILLRGKPSDGKMALPAKENLYKLEKELTPLIRDAEFGGGLSAIIEKNFVAYRRYIAFKTIKEQKQVLPCLAGRSHLVIFSNGDVHPCELLPPIGNIHKDSLEKIIKSPAMQKAISKIKSGACFCTHECNMLENILFNPLCYPYLIKQKKW